jgi:chromosome segregation ATPase
MADLKRRLFGYSSASVRLLLTERDAALERASKNASAAEQRAERLSSELSETKGRLAVFEEQLETAEKLCATLTADLEGAVAQRESMEAEVITLRPELEEAHSELRAAKQVILGQEEQLRVEQARLTELEALVEGYREVIEGRSAAEISSIEPSDAQETPSGPSTASELAAVIEVAERAVASVMESARVRADEELRAVDGERERIRRDVETMTAWRDRAAPMIASLQAAMHEIQSQGAEIGRRVIEALRPVSTAVTALDSQLASLDDLARAPVDVSTEAEAASAPAEADDVMELPEEHPAGRDASDW